VTAEDWIEHRRGDRELLGWMLPEGDGFVVIDLLGRPRTAPLEWLAAEEFLEDLGIGYLADRYLHAGRPVRIGEVSTAGVTVIVDDFGAASAVAPPGTSGPERIRLPFPVPAEMLVPA
jgi:hypothetical protein